MESTTDVLTIADHALLLALRGWAEEVGPHFWDGFAPEWKQTLRGGWDGIRNQEAEATRRQLRLEHQAEARPDLSRVHPSWWLRALKDETPAVQRVVAAAAPLSVRDRLCIGLGLKPEDLEPDRPPLALAVQETLALWSERLIGDLPDRLDPPAVVVLTRNGLRDVARLVHAIGLVKLALSSAEPGRLLRRDQEWLDGLQRDGLTLPSGSEPQARRDVSRLGVSGRHALDRIGLLTIARLLDPVEPYRVRWALQHLPYPVAKLTRSLMSPKTRPAPSLVSWEARIFETCRDRLRSQGHLKEPQGDRP